MTNLREMLNEKPWVGWALAGVAVLAVAIGLYRAISGGGGNEALSSDSMSENVTIVYADTNDRETMPRGRLVKILYDAQVTSPSQGLLNPKTKQPTGKLASEKEWEQLIAEVNAMRSEAAAPNSPTPPAPPPPPQP